MLKRTIFKKTARKKERTLLDLPVVDQADLNIANLCNLLDSDTPLWTWYSFLDRADGPLKEEEYLGLESGMLDALAMWRREDNYLCKYNADSVPESHELILRLEQVWPYKTAVLIDVIRNHILPAHRVYQDPEHRSDNCMAYEHDLTAESIKEYLRTHNHMYVTPDHFKQVAE